MEKRSTKIISLIVTISVITILIISGPALAVTLGINVGQKFVKLGEKIQFSVASILENSDNLPIDKFTVELTGPTNKSCDFLPNGTAINGCDTFILKQLSSAQEIVGYGYLPCQAGGYGYGYGYCSNFTSGTFAFNISIDSKNMSSGIYSTRFIMYSGNNVFEKIGDNIYLYGDFLRGCSVRAQRGEFDSEVFDGSRNRISFSIPLKNAVPGTGTLISQERNQRLVYDFTVLGVLENSENSATIISKGSYKLNRNNFSTSDITLMYLDKKNKELSIAGKKISVVGMDVNLAKGC